MATSSKKVILAAFTGNTLIAVTKFIAAGLTGSSAMFSEGIHSVVDTGNQVLLLHGMRRARKPPSDRFPFGHGKEIYFWSFAVAILIFAVGSGVSLYEGIIHTIHPEPIAAPIVNYIVLGFAMLFEGMAWIFALTEFTKTKGKWGYIEAVRRGKDPTMFVVLFEDSAAMLGIVTAFLGVLLADLTGILFFDTIASIIIGLILGGTAVWLAYETKGLLIGESANQVVIDGIREIILSHEGIDNLNEVLTMHMGPDFVLVNVSIDFRDNIPAGDLEEMIAGMDAQIKARFPSVKRVFVEAESRRLLQSGTPLPKVDSKRHAEAEMKDP
jgi:cation diffusion facilitator family transporter